MFPLEYDVLTTILTILPASQGLDFDKWYGTFCIQYEYKILQWPILGT